MPCSVAGCLLFLSFLISSHAAAQSANQTSGNGSAGSSSAQSAPGQTEKIPQPGELGSPFPEDHAWRHFALELGGGFVPVLNKGAGLFSHGFNVTAGVVDHVHPRLDLALEVQYFGLQGSSKYTDIYGFQHSAAYSNTDFAFDFAASYALISRGRNSPYLVGGIGYYYIGSVPPSNLSTPCSSGVLCPTNLVNSADKLGFQAGVGFRHRLYSDKDLALFGEGRYHYIASASSAFGQISVFPISAGIRW